MRLHHTFIALGVTAALSACTAAQDKSPDVKASRQPTPAEVANPMASFARMVSGEWEMAALNGTSMFDTWHWGPGRHSVRVMTDGSGANGKPWREVQVYYWHPGRKQICLLGLSPYAAGVSEGTIELQGETADAVFDLFQAGAPPVRRKMGLRWTFEGRDKYHEILLEANGPDGLKPMNEWDHVRTKAPAPRPRGEALPMKPSERLKPLEPLLGRVWDAWGKWATGGAFHIESTFEWIPLADAIYARSFALRGNGEPIHMLDAYIYRHTGTDRLRCLVLTNPEEGAREGGVYEGDLSVLEGGGLQLDLMSSKGEQVVPFAVRFDFEKDGALHHRVWSDGGAAREGERTLMLDVRHAASEMSKSILVVYQDKKNNYWFGSDIEGVYRYDGKALINFTTRDGLPSNRIREIQEDKAGSIYITTLEGISKFDGRTFTTLAPIETTEWKSREDDLWFKGNSLENGPYRYDGTSLFHLKFPKHHLEDEHYRANPNPPASPYGVYTIYRDSRGCMWFGTAALGVFRFDGKEVRWLYENHLTNPPGGGSFGIRSIIEDKDGRFWFCNTRYRYNIYPNDSIEKSNNLLSYKKEKIVGNLEAPDGDNLYYMSIAEDNNRHLWMATWSGGVWRHDGEKMTHYPVKDGDKDVTLFSIYKDNNGALWLGTHEAGAYKFNGQTFEKFKP